MSDKLTQLTTLKEKLSQENQTYIGKITALESKIASQSETIKQVQSEKEKLELDL